MHDFRSVQKSIDDPMKDFMSLSWGSVFMILRNVTHHQIVTLIFARLYERLF